MTLKATNPGLVWGAATLMVTIVSCCSLIGVSIMPLISGPSYKVFITLFTGLAVGSLLGSAIFSLIPQAFALHLQADKAYLWKSLVIFFGIYLFYCSERLMRIYFDRKTRKNNEKQEQLQLKKNKSSANIENEIEENSAGDNVPRITDKSCVDPKEVMTEISLAKDDDHHGENSNNIVASLDHNHHGHHHFHGTKPQEILTKALKEKKTGGVVSTAKKVIAPVAWMIIIGDGLHNFIDGLSIGAAFSESMVLGMSTSVAVIFEEFPHELGDFAVLISSGMSVKQALGFNFLSACTCYIGMVFGILLGDMTQSASYIFALAGGMFLYISLVDMMGELSAMLEECKNSTSEVAHLLLMQNIGILTGIIIIFILSLVGTG